MATGNTHFCSYAHGLMLVLQLFTALAMLKRHAEGSAQIKALVDAVEDLKRAEIGKMARMQEDGSVTFEYLQHLFSNGTKIVTNRRGIDGMLVGGKVWTRGAELLRESEGETRAAQQRGSGITAFEQHRHRLPRG